jgi:hypothetical protein
VYSAVGQIENKPRLEPDFLPTPNTPDCVLWPACFYECSPVDKFYPSLNVLLDDLHYNYCETLLIGTNIPDKPMYTSIRVHLIGQTLAEALCKIQIVSGLDWITKENLGNFILVVKRKQ